MNERQNKIIPFYGSENRRLFEIERQSMDKDRVVITYLDQILPDGQIIDIGAGNGYTAALLTRSNRRVVPYEPSSGMIDWNQSLPWVRGIAQELPFKSDSFEGAYATWAYFFPAIGYGDAGLKELARVVKHCGPIIIVDNAGEDAFCGLFERNISSDSSWWHSRGFESHILETTFKFDSTEEAQELLSFYWTFNGRKLGSDVTTEIAYKVSVFLGKSGHIF